MSKEKENVEPVAKEKSPMLTVTSTSLMRTEITYVDADNKLFSVLLNPSETITIPDTSEIRNQLERYAAKQTVKIS